MSKEQTRWVRRGIGALVLFLIALFGLDELEPILNEVLILGSQPAGEYTPADLVRVVDGDTVEVRVNGVEERIRLLDIDTPEVFDESGERDTCFGQEASDFAKLSLCGNSSGRNCNTTIYYELDPLTDERDRFGRILAHVYVGPEDKVSFNETLLTEGYARYNDFGDPGRYAQQYRAAERAARSENLGLWGSCDP